MDRLEAINTFVAVAELRSFAAAARRLRLSPSVVTRSVAALERRLGARLLQRTTRSVRPTEAGARFLEQARRILAALAEAEAGARSENAVPSGQLVVAAPNVFGRLHVAPLIARYLAKYPELSGELTLSDHLVNLVDEGIDLAIRIGPLEDASYVARSVGATRRVIVAAPSYLKTRPALRSYQSLAKHDLIQVRALHPVPEWRLWIEGVEQRFAFEPKYVTNSADAAIAHAELGGGLAMVLGYQAAAAVRAGRLRIVLPGLEPAPLPIRAVYPSTRLLSAKVRAFIELLTQSCDWNFVKL